jgi:capsid protein
MTYAQCARAAAAAHRRLTRSKPASRRQLQRSTSFKGADFNRLTYDWTASRVPADEEIRYALGRLRARARDLARNNPYVRQYLNLLRVNVVGPEGPKLQAQVRNNDTKLARGINDRIEAAWAEWAEAPTVDGKLSLVDFQQLSIETVAKEGEAFVRLRRGFDNPFSFALEAIDPDLIDELVNRPPTRGQAEIRMGIEIDQYGRPLAYHVWDAPLAMGGITSNRRMERVPAEEIIHLCRLAASAMGFFTRKEGGDGLEQKDKEGIQMEANPGSFAFAPEGYEFTSWDPQHPNANYQTFVKGALRKIASGLGLSYNVLANDLENVNYSSMRSGLGIERDLWKSTQRWWVGAFLQPIYAEWMNMALLSGGLSLDSRDRRKFIACQWFPRGWPPVDPLDEADAGIKDLQTGLGTRTQMLAERGQDFEETLQQLKREQELAAEYGVDISGPKSEAAAPAKKPAGAKEKEADEARIGTNRVLALTNGHGRS